MNVTQERRDAMAETDLEAMRSGRRRALDEVTRLRIVLRAIHTPMHTDVTRELARIDALAGDALAE